MFTSPKVKFLKIGVGRETFFNKTRLACFCCQQSKLRSNFCAFKKFLSQCLIFLIFFLFASSSVIAEEPELIPIDAVLVLDVSLSMRTADPYRISFDAMNLFVDKLQEGRDRVGIISYAGQVEQSIGLVEIHTYEDREMLRAFVHGLDYASWTDHGVGLAEAIRIMREGREDPNREERQGVIIFLTDGNMNVNSWGTRTNEIAQQDVYDAIAAALEMNVPIHTIGLNFDGNLATEYVNNIAHATYGLAFETANAADIPEIIEAFFHEMLRAPQERAEEIYSYRADAYGAGYGVSNVLNDGASSSLGNAGDENMLQYPAEALPLEYSLHENALPSNETILDRIRPLHIAVAVVLLILAILLFMKFSKGKRVFTGKLKLEIFDQQTRKTSARRYKNLIEYGNRTTLGRLAEGEIAGSLASVMFMPSPTAPSHLPQLMVQCKNQSVKFAKDFLPIDISAGVSIAMGTEATISCDGEAVQVKLKYIM